MFWYIILAVLVVVVIAVIAIYNGFITLRTRADEAWADIEVQLKRRYDLIPNLVSAVKGYAAHEASAFENVTKARSQAIAAGTLAEHAAAENMLTGALKSLFAVAEAYPDLKANQNFLELQRELADTENKIQAARRFYNGNVRDLNLRVDSFPANLIARWFGFVKKDFFDIPDTGAESEPVSVTF